MKKYKTLILELVILLYLAVTLGFVSMERSSLRCKGVDVTIENKDGNYFIEEKDIERIIRNKSKAIDGALLDSIEILKLELAIEQHPSVENAEVFYKVNGSLCATVTQRKPIARIFNNRNESFYIDDKGKLMPLSGRYTSRVMVLTGNIEAKLRDGTPKDSLTRRDSIVKQELDNLFMIISTINNSKFLSSLIEQIYVGPGGNLSFIPKVGPALIEFGTVEHSAEKFRKLEIFYKKGLNSANWTQYNKLNLKFKNQVVCTKI